MTTAAKSGGPPPSASSPTSTSGSGSSSQCESHVPTQIMPHRPTHPSPLHPPVHGHDLQQYLSYAEAAALQAGKYVPSVGGGE